MTYKYTGPDLTVAKFRVEIIRELSKATGKKVRDAAELRRRITRRCNQPATMDVIETASL